MSGCRLESEDSDLAVISAISIGGECGIDSGGRVEGLVGFVISSASCHDGDASVAVCHPSARIGLEVVNPAGSWAGTVVRSDHGEVASHRDPDEW